MTDRAANRLAGETSPYLLQHAHNPVDWYPWGDEAFARAEALDLPVFLSVGYAACHWCHVMERESFEDVDTARFLNERFVSVKVDREERPDVDGIYMDAVQAMTGQGGWPMSVWLTPDGRPFYAGTYFPNQPRHGMPSFMQVLAGLDEAWRTRRDEIEEQAGRVLASIGRVGELTGADDPIDMEIERDALRQLRASFDQRWGGFGGAPKFPQPMVLEFVLRMAVREEEEALEMAILTLDRMADGGMHDQVGGGFARYSTDAAWHVPHFEKMLYDNAQLARVYTQAWLLTRDDRYRDVATSILEYLLREMQHPEGGFFSSQDADSEGVEGRFFVWSWDELVSLVGEPVATAFGATPAGNWEGTNVLWHPSPLVDVATSFGLDPIALTDAVADARRTLSDVRAERVRPGTDDKVLTAWNGLAIRAFAEAGRAFDEPTFIDAATRCAEFAWRHLRSDTGRLLRSWRDGVAGHPGFADDHALLAGGMLTLYEATGDVGWFRKGREASDALIDLFLDRERGGFFQTGRDADELVVRPKDVQDNAVPSGNSAAADTLLRLSLFTGEVAYEEAAVSALRLVRDLLGRVPVGFGTALCAADLFVGPSREIAVIGDPGDAATRELVEEVVRARFLPNVVLAVGDPADREAFDGPALLTDRRPVGGVATAFVCERFVCRAPVTDTKALGNQLGAGDSVEGAPEVSMPVQGAAKTACVPPTPDPRKTKD